MRFHLSRAASSPDKLDITGPFLNAELPPGRVVILRPPTTLYRLGFIALVFFAGESTMPSTAYEKHLIFGLKNEHLQ